MTEQQEIHSIIQELLRKRGYTARDDVAEFLSSKPQKTYEPFLLKGMKEGVSIILETIKKKGRICIYGDYDADGVTSVCIMMTVLRQFTERVSYYIPSRFQEGYGLNCDAIRAIHEKGAELLLTVDCGSVSFDEVEYAKSLGMEVLVTDHHSIHERQADCTIINPKQADCPYPFDGLAGCGVAYKIAQALQRTVSFPKEVIFRILDLVTIGTIGDIVPLVDENRTIVKYGLREIHLGKRLSLRLFLKGISLTPELIRADQIAFGVVPHLNAAGRMDRADTGVKLLLSEDRNEIMLLTEILKGYNHKRKELQQQTYELCLHLMQEQCADSLLPVIEAGAGAHEGITGIVAGKLKDKTGKPVIIVTPSGDYLKGTGRSIDTLNLYDIMKQHEDLFLRFGGHQGACGFLMETAKLPALRQSLNEEMEQVNEQLRHPAPYYDMDLGIGQVTMALAEALERLAPFGKSNPRPIFRIHADTAEQISLMGEHGMHLRFTAASGGSTLPCVLFGRAQDFIQQIRSGHPMELYCQLLVNEWNGVRSVQARVMDIR